MDYEESLMIKAAWYYYFEEMTQQHVAELMGITRMRVIKLLEKARQTGIIQFRLRKDGESRMQLERNLMSAFGLQDAFVIPAAIDRSAVNAGVAEAASMYISERLTENSLINIGYGDTPSRILNNLATLAEQPLTCVSLTGGVSYYLPDTRSNVFNAKLHLIPAPLLTGSREMGRGAPPRGQRHGAQPHDGPRPDDGGRRGRHARERHHLQVRRAQQQRLPVSEHAGRCGGFAQPLL